MHLFLSAVDSINVINNAIESVSGKFDNVPVYHFTIDNVSFIELFRK